MEEDNKSYTECIFCSKADEEDMILIVKFLETCAESINSWIGNRSSNGDGLVVTDGTSRLRFSRIFKLRNFKKALNALLKQKYGDLGDCSHLHYCQKFTRFLLSFDDIAKEGSGGLIGGRENTPETSEKPKVHVEHAIKLFSLAIKKEWLRIAKVKTLFFDIEKKLSRIEEAHKLNALQVNNHAFEENLQKSESSDYREIARSKSSSFKDNRLGKRKRFDSKTRNVLEDWYLDNINNPYPR